VRASIYQYNADGTGGRLFARGLRNAEGLAVLNGTLWVTVNHRDNIAYPLHNDWNGDGSDDYGKVMQSYVDNHPPELFTSVRDGGNYGWPFCNPNPDTPAGYDLMPFDRDVQLNASGSALDCNTADRPFRGIQAHSAPLGFIFLQGSAFPSAYQGGAALAYHGSWNRSQKTGYKVAYFPFDPATQQPGDQIDLVRGWATTSSNWGRPVDVAVDAQGALFIGRRRAPSTSWSTRPHHHRPDRRITRRSWLPFRGRTSRRTTPATPEPGTSTSS
jgi:glucose/arabinose dehydrogenase